MLNKYLELASVGNVPSNNVVRTHVEGFGFKKLSKVVADSIRKVDVMVEAYFSAMATARSRKPEASVSTLQCHY